MQENLCLIVSVFAPMSKKVEMNVSGDHDRH